jgi:hypothetical protein
VGEEKNGGIDMGRPKGSKNHKGNFVKHPAYVKHYKTDWEGVVFGLLITALGVALLSISIWYGFFEAVINSTSDSFCKNSYGLGLLTVASFIPMLGGVAIMKHSWESEEEHLDVRDDGRTW